MATAKKAELGDAKLKILIWGDPGAGKSRFALSSPSPLVIDTENSTALYAKEFDFMLAEVDRANPVISNYVNLTTTILKEFQDGEYPDIKTLVVDNITDVLDGLEKVLMKGYEEKVLKTRSISDLNKLELSKWYSYRKEYSRLFLDNLKANPTHVVFTGRSRLEWKQGQGGMQPSGNTIFDGLEIVESLMDVIIHLKKEKQGDVKAIVKKSRLADLPDVLPITDFSTITNAIQGIYEKYDVEVKEEKAE